MDMDSKVLLYVLTFFAVVSSVAVFWGMLSEVARAKEESLDADRIAAMRTEEFGNPVYRFVRRGRLFRIRVTLAAIFAAVAAVPLVLARVSNIFALVLVPLVFATIGAVVPFAYYTVLAKRRQSAFEGDILDFTLGIANALKSGIALPQAIEKVSSQFSGPMKEELSIVLREYRLGSDLVTALERMDRRMPCEDIRLLVSAIRLTTGTGGSLASVLAEMSAMIRGRRELADKIKALTAEGRFEAVVMSCAPVAAFFILYFQDPELMRPLYTTSTGWLTIGGVIALVLAGYMTIRKIISIEV